MSERKQKNKFNKIQKIKKVANIEDEDDWIEEVGKGKLIVVVGKEFGDFVVFVVVFVVVVDLVVCVVVAGVAFGEGAGVFRIHSPLIKSKSEAHSLQSR